MEENYENRFAGREAHTHKKEEEEDEVEKHKNIYEAIPTRIFRLKSEEKAQV